MFNKTKKLIFIFLATIFALSFLMAGLGSDKVLAATSAANLHDSAYWISLLGFDCKKNSSNDVPSAIAGKDIGPAIVYNITCTMKGDAKSLTGITRIFINSNFALQEDGSKVLLASITNGQTSGNYNCTSGSTTITCTFDDKRIKSGGYSTVWSGNADYELSVSEGLITGDVSDLSAEDQGKLKTMSDKYVQIKNISALPIVTQENLTSAKSIRTEISTIYNDSFCKDVTWESGWITTMTDWLAETSSNTKVAACQNVMAQANGAVFVVQAKYDAGITPKCASLGDTEKATCISADANVQAAQTSVYGRTQGAQQAVNAATNTLGTSTLYDGSKCISGDIKGDITNLVSGFPFGFFCWGEQGVLNGINWMFGKFVTTFSGVLTVDSQSLSSNDVVKSVSNVWVTFINSLFLLVALISILVTTLKIDLPGLSLNSWQLKRMIPTIIATMVLVNYSLSIANLVIEIMNYLVGLFPSVGSTDFKSFDPGLFSVNGAGWGVIAFRILFLIAYLLIILYLLLLLWIRKIVLVVLYMFAPVPYITNIIPVEAIKKLTSQWWTQFANWAFMGPLVAILLYAAGIAMTKAFVSDIPGTSDIFPSGAAKLSLTNMILVGVLLYLAATMPLKLGGAIMSGLQKATTSKAGKVVGKAAKGTAQFYTSKAARSMGLPSIEEVKKGFAESRRVSLARSETKGEKKRANLFGGVSAMSDIFENYANLKGVRKLPFTGTRQKKIQESLLADNKKLRSLQEERGKLMDRKAQGEEGLDGQIAEVDKKMEGLPERIKANDERLMMLKPSNYNTRSERMAREMEEMKKLSGINRSEELIALFKKAEREKNQTRASAIYRQLAGNLDENEIYNAYGYGSGAEGMKAFTENVLMGNQLGMSEQQALALQTDIAYAAEQKGHMNVAKSTVMENGVARQAEPNDQIKAVLAEVKKWDAQKQAINLSRLNFIEEKPGETPVLHELGKRLLVEVLPSITSQIGRANMSLVENITTGNIMGQILKVEGVNQESLQALIGKRLGYGDKDERVNSINVGDYAKYMQENKDNWQSFKKDFEKKHPKA